MNQKTDYLYNLLPAIYRVRDLERGEPLRALLAILETELDRLERDMGGLYDDWFIETCAEWVVPYIGDLLKVRNLHAVSGDQAGGSVALLPRAYVANTLRYRRRKGTAPVLEQLARDVTGWPARAVEFFERLITTQHLNHIRLHSHSTADLRQANALELLGSPFESATHTAEVRRIANNRGRYNIPNIGLFLWRLQPYRVSGSTARAVHEPADGRYTFSPLGNDAPLFNEPQTEAEITHLAEEINVPGPLRRRPLYDDLEAYRQALMMDDPPKTDYFGSPPTWQIFFDDSDEPLSPSEMLVCDLSGWDEAGWQPPASDLFTGPGAISFTTKVAIDPVSGRLAILAGIPLPDSIAVSYSYGFSSDVGGGPYGRQQSLAVAESTQTWIRTVDQQDPTADFSNLTAALTAWQADMSQAAIITITDSASYDEPLSLVMSSQRQLIIQAANQQRPVLRLTELIVSGGDGTDAALTLNGLLIEGGLQVAPGSLATLNLIHCTLVPGRGLTADSKPGRPDLPSLTVVAPNADLWVTIEHSILGPLRLPETMTQLTVKDSIIDSPLRGGPAQYRPALISGSLSTFPTLSSATPTLTVEIGPEGPYPVTLAAVPASLSQARDALEAAIRAADPSAAFRAASVITVVNRLVILPGIAAPVIVTEAEADSTAAELRLTPETNARSVQALLSAVLDPFPALPSANPMLALSMGDQGPVEITLSSVPSSVAQARDQLHTEIRAADPTVAFAQAMVGNLGDQLVVLPGVENVSPIFGPTMTDQTTMMALGLQIDFPAISATDDASQPGPPMQVERSTIFGHVFVRQLDLASETIFTEPVVAERRQVGCTRFCYLPDGSRVPRRYRCQPDLALDGITDVNSQASVRIRLTPIFTAIRYGQPAYAQLSQICAIEIRTGAEDGSEMGVFSHLKQPQREANLRASLEEYLRFGLEAGIFFVT